MSPLTTVLYKIAAELPEMPKYEPSVTNPDGTDAAGIGSAPQAPAEIKSPVEPIAPVATTPAAAPVTPTPQATEPMYQYPENLDNPGLSAEPPPSASYYEPNPPPVAPQAPSPPPAPVEEERYKDGPNKEWTGYNKGKKVYAFKDGTQPAPQQAQPAPQQAQPAPQQAQPTPPGQGFVDPSWNKVPGAKPGLHQPAPAAPPRATVVAPPEVPVTNSSWDWLPDGSSPPPPTAQQKNINIRNTGRSDGYQAPSQRQEWDKEETAQKWRDNDPSFITPQDLEAAGREFGESPSKALRYGVNPLTGGQLTRQDLKDPRIFNSNIVPGSVTKRPASSIYRNPAPRVGGGNPFRR